MKSANAFDLKILFDIVWETLTEDIRFSVLFNGHYYSCSLWNCMCAAIMVWAFFKIYDGVTR